MSDICIIVAVKNRVSYEHLRVNTKYEFLHGRSRYLHLSFYMLLCILNFNMSKDQEKTKLIIKKRNKGDKDPNNNSLVGYIISILIVFVVLSLAYSLITGLKSPKTTEIAISQLATDLRAGVVKDIVV